MKKFAVMMVAVLAFTAAPVLAGPFSDVKAGHWAYEAISKLAQKGIIEGYPSGKFQGNKSMTRYEAAMMVARALEKGGDWETLQKLSVEFADELALLGVKVTALEDEVKGLRNDVEDLKNGGGRIKITVEDRMRFESNNFKTTAANVANSSQGFNRYRVNMKAKVDDNVSAFVSFQDDSRMGTAKQNNNGLGAGTTRNLFLGYVDIKNFGTWFDNFRIGRQTFTLGKGLLFDSETDGFLLRKNYRGVNWQIGAFDMTDYIIGTGGASGANDGLDTKILTVDYSWKDIAAGLYVFGQDRVETPGFGNWMGWGGTLDAKMGKEVVGFVEGVSIKDKGYTVATRGGATAMTEGGEAIKAGLEWAINKDYDISVLMQNRGKDFRVLGVNDDYSDSMFYGNGPLFGARSKAGAAMVDSYNNSKIMGIILGAKFKKNVQLDLWFESLRGDKVRSDLYGAGTNLTGNFDQDAAQAVVTYQYRDNTAFKLRYRSVKYRTGDPDYAILAVGAQPSDYDQVRLDLNVKF